MLRSILLLLPALAIATPLRAEPPTGCGAVFDAVATATEQNYAGHVIKLPDDAARRHYRRFRSLMAARAAAAQTHVPCREVLQAFVGFFADHHLFVSSRDHAESPLPAATRRWNAKRIRHVLARRTTLRDPVEGEWYDAQGRIAVLPEAAATAERFIALRFGGTGDGEPLAAIERAEQGYRIDHFDARGSWQRSGADLHRGGELLVFGVQAWGRPGAATLDPRDPRAPLLRDLGDGIRYLSLPSFMPEYREPLQHLIAAQGAAIAGGSGLIVDVRGNGGGDAIYFPLAPYLLANPIEIGRATRVLASEWTIEHFERMRRDSGAQGTWLDDVLARMRAARGELVPFRDAARDGLPTYADPPLPVVVLQDRGVGSAAEAFVYHVRQSASVVTMGEPTRGNIDYMQVSMRPVGKDGFAYWFGYPLYFESALPQASVDDEGFAPDVALALPSSQWLDFARTWLARDARRP